ncbi:MAG: VWA domain-containing protein [Gemmataceae bacterium]
MSLRRILLSVSLTLGLLCLAEPARAGAPKTTDKDAPKAAEKPRVEVVFCLDTTGSMGGLIDAAKKKIWSISNQITTGKPTPQVKVGLVAFRDRGDEYITKVFDLTEDLDTVYTNLMGFRADGGGDEPESVNQALFDAVHKITWSKDKKVLKMIFLVGDAPPHMDYPDDVKYPETCKEAVKRDIIINTVLCGASESAKDHWLKICRAAEGSFVQIDAGGGPVVAFATPFDDELAKINGEISRSTLVFGRADTRAKGKSLAKKGAELPAAEAADRAAFYARGAGGGVAYDLLRNIETGAVKLESLKDDELPDELKGKTLDQKRAFLDKLGKDRKALSEKALDLDKKRNAFIAKKLAESEKTRARDSFDANVLRILADQARRARIEYAVEEEKKK